MQFDFNRITIGKDPDELDGEYTIFNNIQIFKDVFADMGDVEFGTFTDEGILELRADSLTTLMQDGSQDGTVTVSGIGVIQNSLTLTVVPANEQLEQILNDFTGALNDIVTDGTLLTDMETAFGNPEAGTPQADILDDIEEMQNILAGGETAVDPDQINDMFETFEELSPEDQETFLTTFEGAIPDETYQTFADYFQDGETPPIP